MKVKKWLKMMMKIKNLVATRLVKIKSMKKFMNFLYSPITNIGEQRYLAIFISLNIVFYNIKKSG